MSADARTEDVPMNKSNKTMPPVGPGKHAAVKSYKSLWEYVRFEGSPLVIRMDDGIERVFERIAAAGYDGVECPLPARDQEPLFRRLLSEHKLDYIAQVLTEGGSPLESFRRQTERAAEFGPSLIVSQSGKDSDSLEERLGFFAKALELEAELGIEVAHETHRGRALYTPWHTAEMLRRLDGLKLAADFSHWCCATESLLEEHAGLMALACSRSIHIHGRVGHREGPQVADPRAPEYGYELSVHENWWTDIVRRRVAAGAQTITFTPEFGPPGYMPTLPYTRQPVADLWEVNEWMAQRFGELAAAAMAAPAAGREGG